MEGFPLSLERLDERQRSADTRIRSVHDGLAKLREEKEKQGRALVRIEGQLEEQANDISDLKKILTRILWGLFGAIGVGLMFVVAVATLIIQTI